MQPLARDGGGGGGKQGSSGKGGKRSKKISKHMNSCWINFFLELFRKMSLKKNFKKVIAADGEMRASKALRYIFYNSGSRSKPFLDLGERR